MICPRCGGKMVGACCEKCGFPFTTFMKKLITLLLTGILAVSLLACGSSGNKDTDQETVNVGEGTASAQTETISIEEAANVIDEMTDNQVLAAYLLEQFKESDFCKQIVDDYENTTQHDSKELTMTEGIFYQAKDFEGISLNVLMVSAEMGWFWDGGMDEQIFLLLDMNTGEIYNSLTAKGAYGQALSCMHTYVAFHPDIIYSGLETYTGFSVDDIAKVNEALYSGATAQIDINVAEMAAAANDEELENACRIAKTALADYISSENFIEPSNVYTEMIGEENSSEVTDAILYKILDLDGFEINVVLLSLRTNLLVNDCVYDHVNLFIDPEAGVVIDSVSSEADIVKWIETFSGVCSSREDVNYLVLNAYDNYANWDASQIVLPDSESICPLTGEQLVRLNEVIANLK